MITFDQAHNGIVRFIDQDVLPHLSGLQKLGVAAYTGLASQNLIKARHEFKKHPAIEMLEIIDERDMIDIDRLYNAMAPHFKERISMDIPLLGKFTFDRADLDRLYSYMRG